MAILKSWEEKKAEARAEAWADAVLTVLRVRGIAVPESARELILVQKDMTRLKRWFKQAVVASSIGEVIDDPKLDPDEQAFLMVMREISEAGKAEARTETQADAVLTVLRVRGITVPDAARARILAQKDLEQLKRWLAKALVASSIGEMIDNPR